MLFRDRAIIRLESVDSTNNYAANLIKLSTPPEGTVITAQEQTEGRGQRGSTWESTAGENLLCSMILYPAYLNSSNHYYLVKAVALALRDLVEDQTGLDVFIKWPNDIIVRNRKIAGILVEAAWNDQRMQSAIIGIGLNVNQSSFVEDRATSLRTLLGKVCDVDDCLAKMLKLLDRYLIRLQSGQFSEISRIYRENLYRLGIPAQFMYRSKQIEAVITGVDEQGQLRLTGNDEAEIICGIKDIKFIY